MRCECCDDDGRSRAMLMVCLIFYPPRSPSRRGRRYFPHFRYAACALFFLTLPLPLIAAGRCIISIVLNSLLHRHDNLYLSSQLWVWPCGALLFPFAINHSQSRADILASPRIFAAEQRATHNRLESFLCHCHHRDRRRWERWACPIVRDCPPSTRQATLRIV